MLARIVESVFQKPDASNTPDTESVATENMKMCRIGMLTSKP
jgi:hypothetical protein